MVRTVSKGLRLASLSLALGATGLSRATDPPSAALNPVTGDIEIADVAPCGGHDRVRYVVQPAGGGTTEPILLTSAEADDAGARIETDPEGNTWVVWWRNSPTPDVRFRARNRSTGSWSAEARISGEGEAARYPEITHDGVTLWVTYEVASTSSRSIVVSATDDNPEPFPTVTSIATTTFSEPDPLVQSVLGHVWVSWVDSSTVLKWSEYDHDAKEWGAAQSVSYGGSSVDLARKNLYDGFY